MPKYTFAHKDTGDEFELTMSYDELISYLNEHPELNQVFRMNVVDPVGIGVSKPPSDFQKYVLGKVKEANPHADAVASKRWNIPREV
jgi:hypothetical protein